MLRRRRLTGTERNFVENVIYRAHSDNSLGTNWKKPSRNRPVMQRKLESTDAELVKAACAGDVESFRQLFERHYSLAVAIGRSRLSDRHLAEDAAQEAFAQVCQRLPSLRDPNRFPEWLGTICRRTASRMARRNRNGQSIAQEPESPRADEAANRQVHEAIMCLPLAAREVVQMHYFGGLTYDEIAAALGTTPQAVHGRLQRARRALGQWLAKQD
ncbi:MAG: sigma-70 family RNA polymerase sigma factor [Pirellulales bacterium]